MIGYWRNIKKNTLYRVTGTRINCTNANDGEIMVEYHDEQNPDMKFCREISEFNTKFQFVGPTL